MTRTLTTLLTALALMLGLAGCGGTPETPSEAPVATTEAVTDELAEATTEAVTDDPYELTRDRYLLSLKLLADQEGYDEWVEGTCNLYIYYGHNGYTDFLTENPLFEEPYDASAIVDVTAEMCEDLN